MDVHGLIMFFNENYGQKYDGFLIRLASKMERVYKMSLKLCDRSWENFPELITVFLVDRKLYNFFESKYVFQFLQRFSPFILYLIYFILKL